MSENYKEIFHIVAGWSAASHASKKCLPKDICISREAVPAAYRLANLYCQLDRKSTIEGHWHMIHQTLLQFGDGKSAPCVCEGMIAHTVSIFGFARGGGWGWMVVERAIFNFLFCFCFHQILIYFLYFFVRFLYYLVYNGPTQKGRGTKASNESPKGKGTRQGRRRRGWRDMKTHPNVGVFATIWRRGLQQERSRQFCQTKGKENISHVMPEGTTAEQKENKKKKLGRSG